MKGLTEKQRKIVDFIEDFMNSARMAPTIYEIAEHFQIKTSTVFAHIRALQKKNYLSRSSKARSISLTRPRKKQKMPVGLQSIPLVNDSTHKELLCDSKLFRHFDNDRSVFAMHVKGSDLISSGILDGDIVILKSQPLTISSGDIVLTEVDGENVLRTCYPVGTDTYELRAGNIDSKAMTAKKENFRVKGVVIGLQRSM